MRPLAVRSPVLMLVLALAAGCGGERAGSRSLFDLPARSGVQRVRCPDAGLTVVLPGVFTVTPARRPQLFRASVEEAFVAGFAYPRREQLPRSRAELAVARDRLVGAARRRERTFRLRSTRLTRVAGAPAIELLGDQTMFQGRLRLRSLHVYKGSAEYVVELVAPLGSFARLERTTFPRIRRSLRLTGRVSEAGRGRMGGRC